MKLNKLYVGIFIFSCTTGAVLTLLLLFSVAKFNSKSVTELFYRNEKYDVEVKFLRIYKRNNTDLAVFEIVNNGLEPLSFMGYNKQDNCYSYIAYRDKIEYADNCSCGTGLGAQSLQSGEKTTFTSKISETKGDFVAGYDFFVKDGRHRKTYWSEIVVR